MRVGFWILLMISFAFGLCCAFAVRFALDELPSSQIAVSSPTVRILVAKRAIALGTEIMAEDVAFETISVLEVPNESIADFQDVYKRRSAYSIPAGYPVCADMLIPEIGDDNQAKFIPVGTQIVALEVEHIQVGDAISEIEISLADLLKKGSCIDIYSVPQQNTKGELVEKRNLLLRSFQPKYQGSTLTAGELVLQKIQIHRVVCGNEVNSSGVKKQTLSLLLDTIQAEQLNSAAKRGCLQVVLHPIENDSEIASQKTNEPIVSDVPKSSVAVIEKKVSFSDSQIQTNLENSRKTAASDKNTGENESKIDGKKFDEKNNDTAIKIEKQAVQKTEIAKISEMTSGITSEITSETMSESTSQEDSGVIPKNRSLV
ncbi:MAG: Flp pilus assembly protein CpaB, partial [Thermoguttaceae bacterium]